MEVWWSNIDWLTSCLPSTQTLVVYQLLEVEAISGSFRGLGEPHHQVLVCRNPNIDTRSVLGNQILDN
jgi:hypothetical protein